MSSNNNNTSTDTNNNNNNINNYNYYSYYYYNYNDNDVGFRVSGRLGFIGPTVTAKAFVVRLGVAQNRTQ